MRYKETTQLLLREEKMNKGDKVYISVDGKYWYKSVFVKKSVNGRYYVEGYDRGLRFCKEQLNEDDVLKGVFNHYEVFWK